MPAHGRIELKPGSFHVMLFELKGKPAPGDRVKLTLTLDDGSTVTTDATVRQPGQMR
ncbi:MAG: copper chaperone PCu(A)C [Vicinamibacterales bacterium]